MRLKLFLVLVVLSMHAQAQLWDDFSDGDFTSNPVWSGDTQKFKINSSKKLQLNASGTDTAFLVTANSFISNTEWSFYIKQSFNSSANNHSRIYLVSDKQNLKGALHGYFVQFGSTQDDICLYRQDSLSVIKLISGTHGNTGNSTNAFTLKVTRDTAGNWELFSDATAGNAFVSEGTATDNTYKTTAWFGIFCKFTSSNSKKFYFDDFSIAKIAVDTVAPEILSVNAATDSTLDVFFSETVDDTSAAMVSNYLVDNGTGQPVSAQRDASNTALVHLSFSKNFVLGKKYQLTAGGVKDLKGNVMKTQSLSFHYYVAQPYDVVFNEIMADPLPVVGLNGKEYIELYNVSKFDINLGGWQFINKTKILTLPDSTIESGGYLILCDDDDAADFQQYGKVIGLSSFSLMNSGQQLILKNAKGGIIHQIKYSLSWYGQSSKSDGGWSLEQIDPSNPCGCGNNWWASDAAAGGTPGKVNSVNASNPDIAAPKILRVSSSGHLSLTVQFSEPMDSASIKNIKAYFITDSIGFPVSAKAAYPSYTSVKLALVKPLDTGKIYKLQIKDSLFDCTGHPVMINTTVRCGISEPALKNDIVINEILFNPKDNGVDFVEIYNRSNKIINLKDLRLANYDEETEDFDNIKIITGENLSLFPGEYFVLTTAPKIVKKQYHTTATDNFLAMDGFPQMSNTSGNVYLMTVSRKVIDSFYYDEDMHYPLLSSTEGVSLERINYDLPSTPDNWHSAAETVGFATPAYRNSQFSQSGETTGEITTSPEIFSPDNDGYNDVLNINYNLSEGTTISKILVFNAKGQPVKTVTEGFFNGPQGTITWDGTTDNNHKAPIGIYIIFVETINLNGEVKNYKLVTTLAGRF